MAIQWIELRERFVRESISLSERIAANRKKILGLYGTSGEFCGSLNLTVIDNPDDGRFKETYDFYAGFFPLEEERDTLPGFRRIMALNFDADYQHRMSPFRETWIMAHLADGETIAGVNFAIYTMPGDVVHRYGVGSTLHVTYIFVKKEYRSLGVAGYLLRKMEEYAAHWVATVSPHGEAAGGTVILCEQNAPELMSPEEYFADCIDAGIDQCDRLAWWDRKGYKRLNINYVQPALNCGGNPCEALTLNMKTATRTTIQGGLLLEHIRRFFELSVLKGSDPMKIPYFRSLSAYLLSSPEIGTSGNEEYYMCLKTAYYDGGYNSRDVPLFEFPQRSTW